MKDTARKPNALVGSNQKLRLKTISIAVSAAIASGTLLSTIPAFAVDPQNPYSSGATSTTTTGSNATITPVGTDGSFKTATTTSAGQTSPAAGDNTYSNGIANASDDYSADEMDRIELANKESLKACAAETQEVLNQIKRDRINTATIAVDAGEKTMNIGTVLGAQTNEKNKGCFTAGQEIFNLATLIPTADFSISGAAGAALKTIINKKVQELKQSVYERGCRIANESVMNALSPIKEYMSKASEVTALITKPEDLLGNYLADRLDIEFDRADMVFNEALGNLKGKIDAETEEVTSKVNANKLDEIYASLNTENNGYEQAQRREQLAAQSNASTTAATNNRVAGNPTYPNVSIRRDRRWNPSTSTWETVYIDAQGNVMDTSAIGDGTQPDDAPTTATAPSTATSPTVGMNSNMQSSPSSMYSGSNTVIPSIERSGNNVYNSN